MKLFVFDVDGTLVHDGGEISLPVLESIQHRLDSGDAIAIASGRPFIGIDKYLSLFEGKNRYAIGSNGAILQDSTGKVLGRVGLQFKDLFSIRKEFSWIEKDGGAIYAYDKNGNVIALSKSIWTDCEVKYNGLSVNIIDEHSFPEDEIILKVMVAASSELISSLRISEEDNKRFNIVKSDPKYLEFMNHLADKATGVAYLIKKLGIKKEDVYTFGDEQNDLRMIEDFQGIAMGNAIEICKEKAKFVTKSVYEDGIAYALNEYIR
ncbi:MAG TPA: hypothetical protein DDW18_01215 [Firmicutes bacterium]|nr:hypothetical protein [Bacillota bacterium]HBM99979.1 hypothetical protein [Bacillota bacterium]